MRNANKNDSAHIHRKYPFFQKSTNNILLLLTWSSTYHGQILEVLSDWITSKESSDLYQKLIENLSLHQTIEDFALSLAALLCRERLLPYNKNDERMFEASFLVEFDAIMNDQNISNRRTVFEQMIMSLMRVLKTKGRVDMYQFLEEILEKEPFLLQSLDDVADQYCLKRLHGHQHNKAFEVAREELLISVEAMLKSERKTGDCWIMCLDDQEGLDRSLLRLADE